MASNSPSSIAIADWLFEHDCVHSSLAYSGLSHPILGRQWPGVPICIPSMGG